MSKKACYRIRNWSKYNEALVKRGSITFWFSDDAIKSWESRERTGLRGRPQAYTDVAIQCMLMIRSVFHLPLRGLEGFTSSLITMLNLDLSCPDYTTVCKRCKSLNIRLPKLVKPGQKLHVLVDSSGFKIYGEGEWKTRKHGISKRRTWRKLHIAVCAETQSIVGAVLTTNDISDSQVFAPLLDGIDSPIDSVYGDGAYDAVDCYDICDSHNARLIAPPRRGAKKSSSDTLYGFLAYRDQAISMIEKLGGDETARKEWKKRSGYHKRSLVETQFFRLKTIFGSNLRSRMFDNQAVESFARCAALNMMTGLGMPQSYKVPI